MFAILPLHLANLGVLSSFDFSLSHYRIVVILTSFFATFSTFDLILLLLLLFLLSSFVIRLVLSNLHVLAILLLVKVLLAFANLNNRYLFVIKITSSH